MNNTALKKLTLPLVSALALSAFTLEANAQVYAYWQDQNGAYVKSGTGSCVRTGSWTPELATAECDPDLVPQHVAVADAAAMDSAQDARTATPAVVAVEKTIVTPDTLFDTDQAVIKPSGKATLDHLIANLQGSNSVIIPIGYASSPGTADYNMQLSERRAEAVKEYLVSQGIDSNRIYIASRGEQEPVASNSTAAGRALNRRVEIEVKAVPPLD